MGSKNSPKATIKEAIKTVNTNGTIYLAAGTYNESGIYIGKNLKLIGDSTKTTIINSQKKHTITVAANVLLKSFTIQNAKDKNNGGAIYNKGTLTLEGLKIQTSSSAQNGGAIYNKGKLTATKTAFSSNNANYGGTIYNIGKLTLNRCTFTNNKANKVYSAIYTTNYMYLYGCNFTKNLKTAVYISENNKLQSIKSSSFTNNNGSNGGAIYNNKSSLTIEKTYFGYNTASNEGGAIYSTGSINIAGSTFTANKAKHGGAVSNRNTITITDNSIKNNVATENGGVIYNTGKVTLKSTKFNNNHAKNGGVLYSKTSSAKTVVVNDCQFTNNVASTGGVFYIQDQTKIDVRNSAFNSNKANVLYMKTGAKGNLIYNSSITKNNATYGGVIRNDGGELLIKSNYITGNSASRGGVLYNNNGNTTLKFNTILNNNKIDVYNNKGIVNANYNWWGSNAKVGSTRAYQSSIGSWIYMTMTSNTPITVNNSVTTIISLNNAYNGKQVTSINPELYPVKISVKINGGGVTKSVTVTNKGYYKFITKFTKTGSATITSTVSNQKLTNTITVSSKGLNTKMTGIFVQKSYSVTAGTVKDWVASGVTDVFIQAQASRNDTALLRKTINLCKNTNIRVHAWVICFILSNGKFDISSSQQNMLKNFIKSTIRISGVSGVNLDYVRYSGVNPSIVDSNKITNFVKSVNSIIKGYDKNLIFSACVFAEKSDTKRIYGQDYNALSPYLDVMLPMTYKYAYSTGRTWLKESTRYVVDRSKYSKVVSVLQTYDEDLDLLSASELEGDARAVMNGGSYGYVLFRQGLISSYPKSAVKL